MDRKRREESAIKDRIKEKQNEKSEGMERVVLTRLHLSASALKYLALLAMTADHIAVICRPVPGFRTFGDLAFPLFAFLLVEGFFHTRDRRCYGRRLLLAAAVSEIPYDLAIRGKIWDFSSQNAMITMCICLVMLKCLDLFKETSGFTGGMLKVLILIAAIVWVSIFRAEYGLCMVLLVFVFYVFESKNVLKTVLGCIISLMYVTGPIAFYGIWCYTGERKNRINKYVYYAFYPLHLLVLGVIANYIL